MKFFLFLFCLFSFATPDLKLECQRKGFSELYSQIFEGQGAYIFDNSHLAPNTLFYFKRNIEGVGQSALFFDFVNATFWFLCSNYTKLSVEELLESSFITFVCVPKNNNFIESYQAIKGGDLDVFGINCRFFLSYFSKVTGSKVIILNDFLPLPFNLSKTDYYKKHEEKLFEIIPFLKDNISHLRGKQIKKAFRVGGACLSGRLKSWDKFREDSKNSKIVMISGKLFSYFITGDCLFIVPGVEKGFCLHSKLENAFKNAGYFDLYKNLDKKSDLQQDFLNIFPLYFFCSLEKYKWIAVKDIKAIEDLKDSQALNKDFDDVLLEVNQKVQGEIN